MMDKKNIIRRSISLPKALDEKITIMIKEYSYTVKNDLLIELLELGILKFNEDLELKNKINSLINKLELILDKLEYNK